MTTVERSLHTSAWMAILVCCLFAVSTHYELWSPFTELVVDLRAAGTPLVFVTLSIVAICFFKKIPLWPAPVLPIGTALFIVFFSDFFLRPFSIYPGYGIRGEMVLFGLLPLIFRNHSLRIVVVVLCLSFLLASPFTYLTEASGRLLFSDDHPTFLYRMNLLVENFPHIPFYNPLWNAGIDERDFFATGALNLFLFFSPVLYLLSPENAQPFILMTILFLILPLSIGFASRILGASSVESTVAGALSASASLTWYQWAFQYGTLGFILSIALCPVPLALTIRFLSDPRSKPTLWSLITFYFLFSLMLLWTPSGIVFFPLIFWAIIRLPELVQSLRYLSLAIALCLTNLPWILLFWKISRVGHFLENKEAGPRLREENATVYDPKGLGEQNIIQPDIWSWSSLEGLQKTLASSNLLLLLFTLPGLGLFPLKIAISYGAVLSWCVLLGLFGPALVPQLELHRFILVAVVLSSIPAARAIYYVLFVSGDKFALISKVLIFAVLAGGFIGVLATLRDRSSVPLHFEESMVQQLPAVVNQLPGDGRLMFSGFVLHDYSHGHVAPLAFWTKRPFIASSQVHNVWMYTHLFPNWVLKGGSKELLRYLELYNVEYILAHEQRELNRYRRLPMYFEEIAAVDKFRIFHRKDYSSNYFLEGQGELIEQNINSVTIRPSSPEVVLKFRYFQFLRSSECVISPESVYDQVQFIKLSQCPVGRSVTIQAKNAWSRLVEAP